MNYGIFTCTICKRRRYSTLLAVLDESAEALESFKKLGHAICGYCKALALESIAGEAHDKK